MYQPFFNYYESNEDRVLEWVKCINRFWPVHTSSAGDTVLLPYLELVAPYLRCVEACKLAGTCRCLCSDPWLSARYEITAREAELEADWAEAEADASSEEADASSDVDSSVDSNWEAEHEGGRMGMQRFTGHELRYYHMGVP